MSGIVSQAKRRYQRFLESKQRRLLEKPILREIPDELGCEAPADRPLRFGVIGAGKVFDRWMRDMLRIPAACGISVQALYDGSAELAKAKAAEYGIPRCCADWQELLTDPEIDAVYVATPNHLHASHAIDALSAGKHVLCEKPIARNSGELERMLEAAAAHDVLLMEGMWMRTVPLIRLLRRLVGEGIIGPVGYLSADCCNNDDPAVYPALFSPEKGGGALMDVGCYALHFAHLFFPGEPAIRASARPTETGVDLTSGAVLSFPEGIALLAQSLGCTGGARAVLHGTEGWIEIPRYLDSPSEFTIRFPGRQPIHYRYALPREKRPIGYAYEIVHFADCVRRGERSSGLIPTEETRLVAREMEEIRRQCGVRFAGEEI